MEPLLSPKEAAACLGCSDSLIRKWMYSNKLAFVKVGRLSRIRKEDVLALVTAVANTHGAGSKKQ